MKTIVVVNNPRDWPLHVPGVEVVSSRSYLTDPAYSESSGSKVFNLCRSYRYQALGYYVSLLAQARGHRPLPSITTIQDLKTVAMIRMAGGDLDELIQKSFAPLLSGTMTLSIYFGRNLAKRYDVLSLRLFNLFPAPLLRAVFERRERWELRGISAISMNDVPREHRQFLVEAAEAHFAGRNRNAARWKSSWRYDLAILANGSEPTPPSDGRALQRFVRAAKRLGIRAEVVTKDDYGRLAEFDGLFIRETTAVNHHTYRFARRAAAEGLVVVDDPDSIVRCANKVYLAEAFARHNIPSPRTMIVHSGNAGEVSSRVGLPCVLKAPDSSFSRGVVKVVEEASLRERIEELLSRSDLVIAQEYFPSEFDWRVGVLEGRPRFVCRYYMAPGHWQIVSSDGRGRRRYGKVEAVPVEEAPRRVVSAAVRAARLIGDGLYGVDVKQVGRRICVIEVNDNPSIDAGYEDAVVGEGLYDAVMNYFYERMQRRRGAGAGK